MKIIRAIGFIEMVVSVCFSVRMSLACRWFCCLICIPWTDKLKENTIYYLQPRATSSVLEPSKKPSLPSFFSPNHFVLLVLSCLERFGNRKWILKNASIRDTPSPSGRNEQLLLFETVVWQYRKAILEKCITVYNENKLQLRCVRIYFIAKSHCLPYWLAPCRYQ